MGCPVPWEGPGALSHWLEAAHENLVSEAVSCVLPSVQAAEAVSDTPHPWKPQGRIFMATIYHNLFFSSYHKEANTQRS